MLQEVSAAMLTGGRGRAARDRGTVGPWERGTVGLFPPSLSDPPSGGPLGGLGGLLEEGEPGYGPQIGGSCRLCTSSRGRLEPSFGSFLGRPGCSIWSHFLFFSSLFLFS